MAKESPSEDSFDNSQLIIEIYPSPFPETEPREEFRTAQRIVGDLEKLKSSANIKVTVPVRGSSGPALDPAGVLIVIAILRYVVGPALTGMVNGIFALLRESRDKKEHRETIIIVQGKRHKITNRNENKEKARIQKEIESYFKRTKKK